LSSALRAITRHWSLVTPHFSAYNLAVIQSVRAVLFAPSRAAFESYLPRANLGRAILFAAGVGLIAGMLGAVINIFSANGSVGDVVVLSMFNAIRFVVSLLLTQGLIYGLASTFGAQGPFADQAYLASLYMVPLQFVAVIALGLNALLPGLGFLISTATLVYEIVLSVPMLRAVFGDEWRVPNWVLTLIAVIGTGVGATISTFLPQ
jgi:hypothetical protein